MSRCLLMIFILFCCGIVAQEVLDERYHQWVNLIIFVLAIPLGWKLVNAPFEKVLKEWREKK